MAEVEEESTVVLPTHTCFDDALDLLVTILQKHPDAANTGEFLLVHAICHRPEAGGAFAHAWVENEHGTGFAFQFGILNGKRELFAQPVKDHYARLTPSDITKYTPRQAWEENRRHENYGPWLEKYLVLCRDYVPQQQRAGA